MIDPTNEGRYVTARVVPLFGFVLQWSSVESKHGKGE